MNAKTELGVYLAYLLLKYHKLLLLIGVAGLVAAGYL